MSTKPGFPRNASSSRATAFSRLATRAASLLDAFSEEKNVCVPLAPRLLLELMWILTKMSARYWLAMVVRSDTHKVKQKTQLSTWQKFSTDFQSNATATARAFRAGDKTKIKPLYLKAAKACADCHSTFRAE